MRRNPTYVFPHKGDTGIYEVPLESIIHVVDSDGQGNPSVTQLIDKSQLTANTTIERYLATPGAYKELDKYIDKFDEISDVNFTFLNANDILSFNGTEWVNKNPQALADILNLGDLGDVYVPAPTDKQVLLWDANAGKWVAGDIDGGTF